MHSFWQNCVLVLVRCDRNAPKLVSVGRNLPLSLGFLTPKKTNHFLTIGVIFLLDFWRMVTLVIRCFLLRSDLGGLARG